MTFFDTIQNFFESIGTYVKNYSYLFLIFILAFVALSIVIIIITSYAYECMLTKTVDKINKFLERNPRINDDNLVAFNNLMKSRDVPKILRRQWQQFMLYREHPASYYMSFKHCVENPMRNSAYRQQMGIYKVISYVLVVLSALVSVFMAVQSVNANLVLQDIVVIPLFILIGYWLVSMILDLIHNATTADLFQNYQYFEINIDKAMLTLPEFVDYEVLFSQDEIRRGIPVLFEYLQKRAVQEQQELEKARLKNVNHEKFDFDEAGLDASLVLDRAMRETENFTAQRKKYMQETERVNNEIYALENNYKEQVKEYQRQMQSSKEIVENLKSQLEQAGSTIEMNYIKKQIRDEINRQQLAEKDFDTANDKHNQEIRNLKQEIKGYEEQTKEAKEALETAMLSEFNTYSVKVYDNLEKIVDKKMDEHVSDLKSQIKGLEEQLEEKNEELENLYTTYQELLASNPQFEQAEAVNVSAQEPTKKPKKKSKKKENVIKVEENNYPQPEIETPEQPEYYADEQNYDYSTEQYNEPVAPQEYFDEQAYDYSNEQYTEPVYENGEYVYDEQNYDYNADDQYLPQDYVPQDEYSEYPTEEQEYNDNYDYIPLTDEANNEQYDYIPLSDDTNTQDDYVQPVQDAQPSEEFEYKMLDEDAKQEPETFEYKMLDEDVKQEPETFEYKMLDEEPAPEAKKSSNKKRKKDDDDAGKEVKFDDADFNFDFYGNNNKNDSDFDFDFSDDIFGLKNDSKAENPAVDEVVKTEEVEAKNDEQEKAQDKLNDDFDFDFGFDDDLELDVEQENSNSEDNFDFDDELPQPVAPKRKAGRPRKVVDNMDEDINSPVKRKPGRPRKIVDADDEFAGPVKRKAGRPRKTPDEKDTLSMPKRRAGRPRKNGAEAGSKSKRVVGRPKKDQTAIKRVGRPPKKTVGRPPKKRPVGRPKKDSKRGPGRPRKA